MACTETISAEEWVKQKIAEFIVENGEVPDSVNVSRRMFSRLYLDDILCVIPKGNGWQYQYKGVIIEIE